jgi:hypothetical protein
MCPQVAASVAVGHLRLRASIFAVASPAGSLLMRNNEQRRYECWYTYVTSAELRQVGT